MLKIDITFDRAAFKRDADSYVSGPFTDGTIGILNGAAEAGQRALVQSMPGVFDEPTPFVLESVRIYKATRRTDGGTPSAMVFVTDEAAAFLDVEITGGVRRAGDAGTTRLGPLVPGPAAPRDRFGNMPRGFVSAAMAEPNVAWVTLKPGAPPALVRRVPGKRLEVLAVIAEETHYEARWDFYGILTRAVAAYVGKAGSLQVFDT